MEGLNYGVLAPMQSNRPGLVDAAIRVASSPGGKAILKTVAHTVAGVAANRYRSWSSRPSTSTALVVPGVTRTQGYFGRYGPGREKKFFDHAVAGAVVPALGQVNSLAITIPQGVTQSERVGRTAFLKNINFRFQFTLPGTSDNLNTFDHVRVWICNDTQCNGADPTFADFKQGATPIVYSYANMDNVGRFQVLKSFKFTINANGMGFDGATDVTGIKSYQKDISKKLNLKVIYNAATGAITERQTNNIVMFSCSQRGLVSMAWFSRVRFTD